MSEKKEEQQKEEQWRGTSLASQTRMVVNMSRGYLAKAVASLGSTATSTTLLNVSASLIADVRTSMWNLGTTVLFRHPNGI